MTILRRTALVPFLLLSLSVFGQVADQAIVSVLDAPDPVIPGNTLTYTITAQNNGPDPAVNGGINLLFDGNFTPTSVIPPAGFSCTALAQVMTCNNPSWAPGGPVAFVASGTVAAHLNTFPDGSLISQFLTSGVTVDPVPGNNSSGNVVTSYNSPQVDLSVAVTDSPDPVFPNGDITYTVDLTNSGPDDANSVNFNVFNNGSLQYQSITIPAGWSCPALPSVGAAPNFTCTRATWAPGTSQFILVLRADSAVLGVNDQSVSTVFSVFAGASDETDDGSDNTETETTQYTTPDADVTITVTDAPDPVFPDGNITYTVTVSNNGPDTAPDITLSSFGSNNLRFVSATIPAGWSCTLPSAGTQTTAYSCTRAAGLPSGGSSVLTFVMQADDDILGINDQTIQFGFQAHSTIADPVGVNNSETESTSYVTPDANLGITASDSPDPVTNGGLVTFTVNAANAGPDSAGNVSVTLAPSPSLTFQSITAPAGWSCTDPGVDNAGVTQCTKGMVNGESAQFTLVTRLATSGAGGTLTSNFSISGNTEDPVSANNNVQVLTAWVGQTSDLSVTKSTPQTAAAQGGTVTYTLATANNGPSDVTNVTASDVLPAQLLFQSLSTPAGWSCTTPAVGANGTVTCTIATFANGAAANFTLVATVAPNATGSIANSASIAGADNTDPNPANSSNTASAVAIAGNADLSITKTGNPGSTSRGSTINYVLSITNSGPDPAASVSVTDTLPASLLFQSINAPGWSCTTPAVGVTGAITCTIASLPLGPNSIALAVTVAQDATGSITNTASIAHSGTDANAGNSSASSAATLVDVSADLSIVKSTAETLVAQGETFAYTISVTNAGPDAAANVGITDTLPANLLFQSLSAAAGFACTTPAVDANGTITCTSANLASGATANFTLTVRVTDDATGTIVNTAAVSSDTPDPDSDDLTSTTSLASDLPPGDLRITKTTAATNVATGSTVTYTLTVRNLGPGSQPTAVVTDTLPAGLQFVSAAASQGSCNASSPVVCDLGSLVGGAQATITLNVQVTATSGSIVNSASVAPVDVNPGNNFANAPAIFPTGGPAVGQDVPTLSEWMLIALMAMLGMVAVFRMRT